LIGKTIQFKPQIKQGGGTYLYIRPSLCNLTKASVTAFDLCSSIVKAWCQVEMKLLVRVQIKKKIKQGSRSHVFSQLKEKEMLPPETSQAKLQGGAVGSISYHRTALSNSVPVQNIAW
jgi:hypothetical protein